MTIKTKIITMTGISLILTSMVIGAISVFQFRKAGDGTIAKIEAMGKNEINRIKSEGNTEVKMFRKDLMARKKEYLKSQIQTALGVLQKGYDDSHSPEKLKEVYQTQLQNAVNTAYSILAAVEKEEGLLLFEKKEKAKKLIKNLRYGPENKDYFWINDMGPTMVMHPYKPQLDGKDLSGSKDPNGKKLFVEMTKICREKGEGFVDYHWPKYGAEQPQPKLSFVRLFEPWKWVVGSGVYVEVAEERLKKDAAAVIGALRFGPENKDYFWINDMTPSMVMHPYKPKLNGKDLSGTQDPNGKKLFVEMAKICREKGEGFVDYHWPKYGADEPQPKLSYVKLFKKWNWILGTGVYVDDIEAAVAVKTQAIEKRVQNMLVEVEKQVGETQKEIKGNIRRTIIWISGLTAGILFFILTASFIFIQHSINKPIQKMIVGMNLAADQVSAASSEVTSTGQVLAEGTSEQAASIEETSASLEQMSAMTQQNSNNAAEAKLLMGKANHVVDKAGDSMNKLTTSMDVISTASQETSKIIKTIDEIAFQTNLLALNAAVEAARAGEAGAGFAVVADEVRNLAIRAAEAASNTAELIEDTVHKISGGTDIVRATSEDFKEVELNVRQVGEIVSEIAAASNEQAQGIGQINSAITEMDKITQQNAAGAEESASSAEELSAQAEQMKGMALNLRRMIGGAHLKYKPGQRVSTKPIEKSGLMRYFNKIDSKVSNSNSFGQTAAKADRNYETVIPLDDKDLSDF